MQLVSLQTEPGRCEGERDGQRGNPLPRRVRRRLPLTCLPIVPPELEAYESVTRTIPEVRSCIAEAWRAHHRWPKQPRWRRLALRPPLPPSRPLFFVDGPSRPVRACHLYPPFLRAQPPLFRPASSFLPPSRVQDFQRRYGIEPLPEAAGGAGEEQEKRHRATVDEKCPGCGHGQLEYYTMQLRSADEGQTVFYEWCACAPRHPRGARERAGCCWRLERV